MTNRIETIRNHLENFRERAERDNLAAETRIVEFIEAMRTEAVSAGDQTLATRSWCLRQALRVQHDFIAAFHLIKSKSFFDAWCKLERVEIELAALERHSHFVDLGTFGLGHIQTHYQRFQKLFPYAVFMSPAYLEKERRCSLCHAVISLRSRCENRPGETGKQCRAEADLAAESEAADEQRRLDCPSGAMQLHTAVGHGEHQ